MSTIVKNENFGPYLLKSEDFVQSCRRPCLLTLLLRGILFLDKLLKCHRFFSSLTRRVKWGLG